MKKTFSIIALLLLFILIFFIFAGFNKKSTEINTKIGFIIPLTGPVAQIAEGLKNTIEYTQTQNIEIRLVDDACEGKKALSAYWQLKNEGVKIFYIACSAGIFSIEPIAKENNDIILTSYAFDLNIRDTGDHVIRFIPDALDVFESMNQYFTDNKDKTFSLLYEMGTYQSLADRIELVLGSRLLSKESYQSDVNDIRTLVTKTLAKNPDELIFLPVGDRLAQSVFSHMQNTGSKIPIIGEFNLCSFSFQALDFGLSSYCWDAQLNNEKALEFTLGYKQKYGIENQYPFFDMVTYDIIKIIDVLVGKYGTVDDKTVSKIKKDILQGIDGEITSYEFNNSGKLKNGSSFLIGKTR
jgi:ABC-type branched-subunit amino acid transport system substrate-binding protein